MRASILWLLYHSLIQIAVIICYTRQFDNNQRHCKIRTSGF